MFCLICGKLGSDFCRVCRHSLAAAEDRLLDEGLWVRSAFRHEGPARELVHQYKYRGSDRAGWMLARALAQLVATDSVLVPIPRASGRHLRYGIDPAPDLARRLQRLMGCQVAPALVAPAVAPQQAGRKRSERLPAPLKLIMNLDSPVVLLDDVLTTGRTLTAAQGVLNSAGIRVAGAITATARGD